MASRKSSVPPPPQPIGARTIEVDASWVIVTTEVGGVEKKEIKRSPSIPPNKTIEVDEAWLEERGFSRVGKKPRPPPLPPPVMLARPRGRGLPPPLPREDDSEPGKK
jgi:hypothetical protein